MVGHLFIRNNIAAARLLLVSACICVLTVPGIAQAQACTQPQLTARFPDNYTTQLSWNGSLWTSSGTGWCNAYPFTVNVRQQYGGNLEGQVVVSGGCNGGSTMQSADTSASGAVIPGSFSNCCVGTYNTTITYSGSLCPPTTDCTFNGQTLTTGSSVTAYRLQSPIESQGQQCESQTRTCTNGTLSGSYQYSSCTLVTPELTPVTAAMLAAFALLFGWQVYRNNSRFAA